MEQYIEIDKIDIDDDTFNISRNILRDDLYDSIKNYGMLEKPILLKKDNRYVLLSCHNRVRICNNLGIKKINSLIVFSPDSEIFFKNFVLKLFRNGAGPAGRIKALNIIDQHFSDDLSLSHGELRRLTGLPIEYIKKKSERDKISAFPRHLLEYIDARDINFKTIRDLLTFDYTLLDWLSGWISSIQIRVNIFKKITEHLFDIARNGKTADIPLHGDGRIKNDSDLHAEVFRVRYPHYSSMNYKASEIINKISSPEVSIGFPEFFEKNHILITLKIFKNNRKGEWRKNIESVSNEDIDELLKLIE